MLFTVVARTAARRAQSSAAARRELNLDD